MCILYTTINSNKKERKKEKIIISFLAETAITMTAAIAITAAITMTTAIAITAAIAMTTPITIISPDKNGIYAHHVTN